MSFDDLILGDSLELLIDNRGKNPPYEMSGVPVVSGMSVRPGGDLDLSESKSASFDTWKQWMPNPTKAGDVIMTSEAPLGRVAAVRSNEPILIAQRVFGMRGRAGILDSRFLFYALQTAAVQSDLASRATGSTVLGIRQPELRKVLIPAPSYDQQIAIAGVLGALDDKIAANVRVLSLCSATVAAEFDAAVATGSRTVTVADIAEFHNRRRVPLSSREREKRRGDIPYYGAAGRLDFVNESLFDEPLVLVGEDGSVINDDGSPVVQYVWGPSWVNNHAHVLTGASLATETLHCALNRANVAHLVTGAVQPKISMGNLKRLELRIPADIGAMDGISTRSAGMVRAISEQNSMLVRCRDTLLPLLMSGKVSVKSAERLVGEAM